jgi:N utilization substance protein B
MLSRRLLRIKILQAIYAHYKSNSKLLASSEEQLFYSINKAYELYHYLFLLLIEITNYAINRIELSRQKKIPTYEDLNPNTKFIENRLIKQIRINRQLKDYLSKKKLSWENYPELIKNIFLEINDSKDFCAYLKTNDYSYEADKKIVIRILSNQISQSEELYQNLEEQSIYWNDDVEFTISMIIKTIKRFKEDSDENIPLMEIYKNEEDKIFVKRLFGKTILNGEEYRKLIDRYTKNWEIDRIAFIDILIMQLAIAEITEFPEIPTKVSFNEYIEISKFYSTPKSSNFINGILDKIIYELKQDKKIVKRGRGLIGESH